MKARRPPLGPQEIRLLALLGVGGLVSLAVLVGVNLALSRVLPGGAGFYAPWSGSRAFLFEGTDPYGGTVAGRAQRLVYGRGARPGEDPLLLDTPFHLLPLYFPFALPAEPALARGIWMALSQLGLLALALLSLRLADWNPRGLFLVPLVLLTCLSFYAVAALADGGPEILLGLLYLSILLALRAGRDELAGGLLALTAFKWEIGGLFLLLILIRLLNERRWRVLTTLGMTLFLLGLISFLVHPGWLLPFARATVASLRSYPGTTARAALLELWPEGGAQLSAALSGLMLLVLGVEWIAARKGDFRRLVWVACLTLAMAPLLAFRTQAANLVVLLPGFILLLAAAHERWRRLGYVLPGALLLLAFAFPWAGYVRGLLGGEPPSGQVLLFFPTLTIAGLYWTRWWVLRPPQTWLDQVVESGAK